MCGHIGIINREKIIFKSEKLIKYFYQGLYVDALRGQHGTGICGVKTDGEINTYKRALQSSDFLELTKTKKIMSNNDNVFLIGHNRHATLGSHTDENTHPFVNNQITLFHNGTLTTHFNLNPGKTFSVDSDSISYLLSTSNKKTEALSKIQGAYALVWYDAIKKSINFARNSERTFFIGSIKDSTSIVWASEKGMLTWLCERNDIDLEEVVSLESGKLLSISLDPTIKIKISSFIPYIAQFNDNKSNFYSKGNKSIYNKPNKIEGVEQNSEIIVTVESWHNYNNSNNEYQNYGYLKCHYKDNIYFNVSGINKSEAIDRLNKNYKIKILSIVSDCLGYGTLLNELNALELIEYSLKRMGDNKATDSILKKEIAVIDIIGDISLKESQKMQDCYNQQDSFDENKGIHYPVKFSSGIKYISKSEYLRKTNGGCSNCTDDLPIEMSKNIRWDSEDNCYCPDCADFFRID